MTFVLGLGPTSESLVGYGLRCGAEVARSDNLGARYGRLAEREGRGRRGPVIKLPSVSPPCDPEKRAKDKSLSEKEREAGAGAADARCGGRTGSWLCLCVSASTLTRACGGGGLVLQLCREAHARGAGRAHVGLELIEALC